MDYMGGILVKKQIKVVIGANFGDEGKGLTTEYFAVRHPNTLVVRFNGGAQAAHTVVLPDSREHVFSHFGSGTLDGIPTYLSQFFLINPILYVEEREKLEQKMKDQRTLPVLYVHRNAFVSTPYDMMINQIAELNRGEDRHGSCGYGISETVVRSEHEKYRISVADLYDSRLLQEKLRSIKEEYVPRRLNELGCRYIPEDYTFGLTSHEVFDAFFHDCDIFKRTVCITDDSILHAFDSIVFEGAQGLLLDQNLIEYSPHITHSNTGIDNVVEIMQNMDFDYEMEVVYVTRSYMTRHGAGPFPTETTDKPYRKMWDLTNVPNPWQGSLRFGILDVDFLHKNVMKDVAKNTLPHVRNSLMVTCLDQIDDKAKYIVDGKFVETGIDEFLGRLRNKFGADWHIYQSWGRTRNTVKCQDLVALGEKV